jgi:hypothetical protein
MAGLPVNNAATYLQIAIPKLAAIAALTTFLEELEGTQFGRQWNNKRCPLFHYPEGKFPALTPHAYEAGGHI